MANPLTPTGPLRQDDWPTPLAPQYPVSLRTWLQSSTAIPFFDAKNKPSTVTDWGYQPATTLPGQFWTSQTIALPYQKRTWPFAQYDWPLPQRPPWPDRPKGNDTWTSNRTIRLFYQLRTWPFAQYDWPVPIRPQWPNRPQGNNTWTSNRT